MINPSDFIILPTTVGIAALAGGILSYVLGKNADSLKSYNIDIDEVKKEIILSKKKGKDKVHSDDVIER